MADSVSSNPVVKRFYMKVGHLDDAGLGGEGWVVRMSDHFDSSAKPLYVLATDYEELERSYKRLQKVCALHGLDTGVAALRSAVETTEPLSSGDAIACISMALQNPVDTQEWRRLLSDCRYVIEKLESELTEAKRQRNDEQRLRLIAERSTVKAVVRHSCREPNCIICRESPQNGSVKP